MRKYIIAALAALLLVTANAQASTAEHRPCHSAPCVKRVRVHRHYDYCNTWRCVRRADRRVERKELRALTPFPGPHGTHWAIPYVIVSCEGGWNGWGTVNHEGSPARGPYQLNGHGEPWPVKTLADRIAHHRIARNLYVKLGTAPWVSSRPCWG